MKHSICYINKPNKYVKLHIIARYKNQENNYCTAESYLTLEAFSEMSRGKINQKIKEKSQVFPGEKHAFDICYSVVQFFSVDINKALSTNHVRQFHDDRDQLHQCSYFSMRRLLEHTSIIELPISKRLPMSQLVYLIARHSAPGITLSSLTKQEAASRLNLKMTELSHLLAKLIKAKLISIEPASFIAPTKTFWERGYLNNMHAPQPSGNTPVDMSQLQERAQCFISHFNALKAHNLPFSYESRRHILKGIPNEIRSLVQQELIRYIQNIKTKVLTIEREIAL
ncbi:hypothetical protein QF117_10405 [Vibrio sp. YMD68]|uniref:hypothetical protein n=1 Tax=Vibrio sp. YMD68 TaxID=3042300 RepID=UPI00249B252E|nr:hypothetical protein [Vibrio sp. YMD68]WGW01204.1 hypothetical protein QF117_10405 [Vibrio sp. YMD68]